MQGNKVMINDETGFTYGGDQMGKYAGGKVATGKKDPAVCGTFSGSMCSMPHLMVRWTSLSIVFSHYANQVLKNLIGLPS